MRTWGCWMRVMYEAVAIDIAARCRAEGREARVVRAAEGACPPPSCHCVVCSRGVWEVQVRS